MSNIEFDVDKVAALARMDLTDKEREEFSKQLPSIMAYVSKLSEVVTSNVDPKAYIIEQENVFRADEVTDCDPDVRKSIITAFPNQKGGALEVPGIFL